MPRRTLVVAPHPDDEVLGCGGTLLRRKSEGYSLGWLIMTGMSVSAGWTAERVLSRDAEIDVVAEMIGFDEVFNLRLPTTSLDTLPMADLIEKVSAVFASFRPEEVFVPNRSDIHTDHRITFDVVAACTKWFRCPSVRRVFAYETISETDFCLDSAGAFRPNVFIDVGEYVERKIEILKVYESELGAAPFPRSIDAVRAQGVLRGVASGFAMAEGFQLLRERQ